MIAAVVDTALHLLIFIGVWSALAKLRASEADNARLKHDGECWRRLYAEEREFCLEWQDNYYAAARQVAAEALAANGGRS